jgi:hypothetical protein
MMGHGWHGIRLINRMKKYNKIRIKVLVRILKKRKKVKKKANLKVDMKIRINPIVKVEVKRMI